MNPSGPPPPPEPPGGHPFRTAAAAGAKCRLVPPAPGGTDTEFTEWLSTQPTWCRYDVRTLTKLMDDLAILLQCLMSDEIRWQRFVAPDALAATQQPSDVSDLRERAIAEVTGWRDLVHRGIDWCRANPAEAEKLRNGAAEHPAAAA